MDTQALVTHAKAEIEEAQGILVKFSQDLLDRPDDTLRFSRPAFEASAQLSTWKEVIAGLNSGLAVKDVVERLHENVLRLASLGTTAANAAETSLNLENLRQATAAYKKLSMYVQLNGNELALL